MNEEFAAMLDVITFPTQPPCARSLLISSSSSLSVSPPHPSSFRTAKVLPAPSTKRVIRGAGSRGADGAEPSLAQCRCINRRMATSSGALIATHTSPSRVHATATQSRDRRPRAERPAFGADECESHDRGGHEATVPLKVAAVCADASRAISFGRVP